MTEHSKLLLLSIAVLTVIGLWDIPAQAHFLDGNALLAECSVRQGEMTYFQSDSECLGYIIGAYDAVTDTMNGICVPRGVKSGQVRDLVVRFLRTHPEQRHLPGWELVNNALVNAWPCK
jgi:hypothetical protein